MNGWIDVCVFDPHVSNKLKANTENKILQFFARYKLKFSADKVDIMIVQAIGLLDDLDKEINIYAMRVREWYGKFHRKLSSYIHHPYLSIYETY